MHFMNRRFFVSIVLCLLSKLDMLVIEYKTWSNEVVVKPLNP